MKGLSKQTKRFVIGVFTSLLLTFSAIAQSTDQNFPSPVTSNEINGRINARDIGDARLTTYYFTFDGGQGDIFVNVVAGNLNGSIDLFTVDGQRPLTKILIFADTGNTETGRLIYLRKPERLLLRIEGRSPNDEAATFRIKFAGSFIASAEETPDAAPKIANNGNDDGGVRVNSVGTIIPIPSKPKPPVAVVEKKTKPVKELVKDAEAKSVETASVKKPTPEKPKKNSPPKKTDSPTRRPTATAKKIENKTVPPKVAPPTESAERKTDQRKTGAPDDPLANLRLLIELKDGQSFWRKMTSVQRMSVEKGILTVVGKDGGVSRYSMLDVTKVTIQ